MYRKNVLGSEQALEDKRRERHPQRRREGNRSRDKLPGNLEALRCAHGHGNEHWEFADNGLMRRRDASINDYEIAASEQRYTWEREE